VQTFVRELFQYDDTINIARSEKFYHPNDLVQQADLFLDGVLKANGHRDLWRALMTSRAGFISTSTAQNYNAKAPTMTNPPSTPQPYTFDGERQGVLGLPAWLSTYAQPDRTDPVVRGRFVQERLLCNTLPNAPVEGVAPLSTDVKVPLRRRFAAHTANPTCRACHGMMDDLGLAFEGFDEYGRARDVEAGVPVDRSGVLRGSGDQDGAFTGLDGLAARLVASAGARNCFVANAFESFMGRAPGDGDTAALAEARRQLDASGDLTPLLQAFFTAQGFVARTRAH
jgi:hypothetical protein